MNHGASLLSRTLIAFLLLSAITALADPPDRKALDNYKWRADATWWFSNPTGFFNGANEHDQINLDRDLGFGSYSTFYGRIDWHMTRRQHIIMGIAPVVSDRTTTLQRTIEYQGVTYDAGVQVKSHIGSLSFSPGYEFDFIRRNGNYVGLTTQIFLLNTNASITGTGFINGQSASRKASGSIFAPLPTIGLTGRWYPTDSGRFAIDGNWGGMYFFGYGNFMNAGGAADIALTRVIALRLGYQMATRLSVHGSNNQIGLRLTQKGPSAGLEFTW